MDQNLEKKNQNEEVEYEEIDGYAKCSTHKQKCLTDCPPFFNAIFSKVD